MIKRYFNKTISILLTMIFLFGLFPPMVFAGPSSQYPGEIMGINKTMFDNSFSKADREINPDRWISEAKLGITQVINSWEHIVFGLYEDPSVLNEAKNSLIKWSNDELEARFSEWLIKRFFGEAIEKNLLNFSQELSDTQKKYSWHLDSEGNVVFDDKTGDPLIIRPNEENRGFTEDITKWKNDVKNKISASKTSYENTITKLFPELLAYIPPEMRERVAAIITESVTNNNNAIKREFENIAAREERVFTSRRTRDIWSLRNKSENEAAKLFTEHLLAETDAQCRSGIEELNIKIEQAEAGVGDLALLGEDWLRLYKEQFERGLKAWEDAEERFFMRRIEWEQDSFKLFSEGEEIWLEAFNQFEEERKKWELNAKDLFEAGEKLFITLSEDFEKNIAEAKKEFELNMEMRINEGTTKVKALIDMYLTYASTAVRTKETIYFWQKEAFDILIDPDNIDFLSLLSNEMKKLWNNASKKYKHDSSVKAEIEELIDSRDNMPPYYYWISSLKEEHLEEYNNKIAALEEKYNFKYDSSYNPDNFYLEIQEVIKSNMSLEEQIKYALQKNYSYMPKFNIEAIQEIQSLYYSYLSYLKKAVEIRDSIKENYTELLGSGALKDVLASDVSSEDFYLDEYQIALLRAKALVLHWEKKTEISQAVLNYADDLSANRITEAEGIREWEKAKEAYYKSLADYEIELNKLNEAGTNVQKQQELLISLSQKLQEEENKLNLLYDEYTALISLSVYKNENYYLSNLNTNYQNLVNKYKAFEKTGNESGYINILINGLIIGIAEALEEPDRNWQESLEEMVSLFNSYGFICDTYYLPDVHDIVELIIDKPGDFSNNTAQFLIDFDNCFTSLPYWLETEIETWKDAFLEYISVYSFINGLKPQFNTEQISNQQEKLYYENQELLTKIMSLENNNETNEEKTNLINDLIIYKDKSDLLFYMNAITYIWENINKASLEDNKHWRQFLNDSYISNIDSLVTFVSTWEEGILADSFFTANYYSNRLNDSFILFSQKDNYEITEDISYYLFQYLNDYYDVENNFNTLLSSHELLISSLNSYELSSLSFDDNKKLFESKENAYKLQEKIYNKVREQYLTEAKIFLNIGSLYDDQYTILRKAQAYNDSKRFEYEKHDAIQRWASTSYIGSNSAEHEENKNKLQKAQLVLNVLTDLYNNENTRTINDSQYNLLFSTYKQSFNQKLKTLEITNSLFTSIIDEKKNNASIFENYQNSLHNLGSVDQDYSNYKSPEDKSLWTGKDIIMVKNGKLAFSRDESMSITGLDESKTNDLIAFFQSNEAPGIEQFKISEYEKALRDLNERMMSYLTNDKKFKTWSLARDYLINSLIKANGKISYLKNVFSGYGELTKGSSLGSQYVMEDYDDKDNLYSNIKNDSIYKNRDLQFLEAWNSLSSEEKADLEFYVIITLTNSNGYSKGFSEVYTQQLFKHTYDYVNKYYTRAKNKMDDWWEIIEKIIYKEMRAVNRSTLNRVKPLYNRYTNDVNKWIKNLDSNQKSIINLKAEYFASCQKLSEMEAFSKDNSNITWEDIYLSLETAKINKKDIDDLKSYWEAMQKELEEKKIVDIEFKSVSDALYLLCEWTAKKETENKTALNNYWEKIIVTQLSKEEEFLFTVDKYMSGITNLDDLKSSAYAAYGKDSVSLKSHYINIQSDLLKDISLFMQTDFNFNYEFSILGEELLTTTKNSLENRYFSELSVREAEWEQTKNGIWEKYCEWQNSAALILENGRMDWITSKQKMEDSYKKWVNNYQTEYNRVSNEWAEAYLAGLEDKKNWLEQAANAANQASSESLLSLVGTEGERLSRFVDTREPLGIRDSLPQAQALMSELLQSSGIANMSNAFASLTNYTGITSPLIRRGMGSITAWDSALTKTAASDLAKISNTEIANNEAKILAYNVQIKINEAIKGLTVNVETANKNFKESMDDLFIFKGLWRKNGNNYTKDIIKGSTLFTPVISKIVNIEGYVNYDMEPVKLKTNLEEYNLVNLNSIAINCLIENAYQEIHELAKEIFGIGKEPDQINSKGEKRTQSPGKFGAHIGYLPDTKPKMGGKRSEMFYDQGKGQLGRLMSDFTYWAVIDNIGLSEVGLAPWDKRIWNDEGSCFSAPSLRAVGQIAGAVVATVVSVVATPFTGVAGVAGVAASVALIAGVSTTNDMIFNTLDVAYGYKTWDEAFIETNKSYAINFASGMLTAGFSGASTVAKTATTTASTIAAQTMMAGVQSITAGFTTSLLSGITYSSENGFGYSGQIVSAGLKNMLSGSLVSMVSTFTTSGLTAINSGFDLSKLKGFNELNQSDLQKLNNLAGSFAGQGVNYALGNDFTLNLLNFSLLSGNSSYNTGLLELHLGRDGTSMNFGTGGANVSIDNLASVLRGAQVWNINNRITRYTDKNDFKEKVTLRAQYGYGDTVQKDQLFDILGEKAIIKTDGNGDYFAETTIDNESGKRVITLSGYKSGMSTEDQFLLATTLGHEAYRDGYKVGETDANGNIVTYESQTNELNNALTAKIAMADRIQTENKWFYNEFEGLAFESLLLGIAKKSNDYSDFNMYLEYAYNNDGDYQWLAANTNGDYQNNYRTIPLFNSDFQARVNSVNEKKLQVAYNRYFVDEENHENGKPISLEEFANKNDLSSKYGYKADAFISIAWAGCMFMSTKYGIETFFGEKVDTLKLHEYIKDNDLFNGKNLLSNELMAKIMTEYSGGQYTVQLLEVYNPLLSDKELTDLNAKVAYEAFNSQPNPERLLEIGEAQETYIAHLRIKEPGKADPIIHSVMLSGIEYKYENGQITGIAKINVANPLTPSTYFNSRESFLPNEIARWDIFKVTKNY